MTAHLGDRLESASTRPRYVPAGNVGAVEQKWRAGAQTSCDPEVRTPIGKIQDKLFELVALAWFGLMAEH